MNTNKNNTQTKKIINKQKLNLQVDNIKLPNTFKWGSKLFWFKLWDSCIDAIAKISFAKLPKNNNLERKKMDLVTFWILILLTISGLASLYSAYTFNIFQNKDVLWGIIPSAFLKQIIFYLLAWFIYWWIIKYFNIFYLKKSSLFFLIIFVILIILTAFVGVNNNTSARRWLNLKVIVIQPAEFGKLIFPIVFAQLMSMKKEFKFRDLFNFYSIWITTISLVAIILVLKKMPDLGTTIAYGFIFMCMLSLANISEKMQKFIAWSIGIGSVVAITFMIFFPTTLTKLVTTSKFQSGRITSFLDPFKDVKGEGYQLVSSIIAIAKGSLLGRGLGNGTQKLGWLPETESDFIFSNVSEELGLVGVIFIFTLFLILFVRNYQKINTIKDQFLKIMSFGLLGGIYANIFLNFGGISGAIPMSGVPLPFFSAGVTNLIITFITLAIIEVAYRSDQDMQKNILVYEDFNKSKIAKQKYKQNKKILKQKIKEANVKIVKVKASEINKLKKDKKIKVKKIRKKGK